MSRNHADNPGDKHGSGDYAGDSHGNTPAAWTAVVIGLLGFAVGGIGLMMGSDLVFWIGVAMVPFALLVLVIMSKMGYGADTRH
jgi:hypothetical protein